MRKKKDYEEAVIEMANEGKSNSRIAEALKLATGSVSNWVSGFRKRGLIQPKGETLETRIFNLLIELQATSPARDWYSEAHDRREGKTEEKRKAIHEHTRYFVKLIKELL